jgi:hypothetical protein
MMENRISANSRDISLTELIPTSMRRPCGSVTALVHLLNMSPELRIGQGKTNAWRFQCTGFVLLLRRPRNFGVSQCGTLVLIIRWCI